MGVDVYTLLSGEILVEIEGVGDQEVSIEGEPAHLYVVVSHVYAKLTGKNIPLENFLKNTEVLRYQDGPQRLKVRSKKAVC